MKSFDLPRWAKHLLWRFWKPYIVIGYPNLCPGFDIETKDLWHHPYWTEDKRFRTKREAHAWAFENLTWNGRQKK